MSKPIASTNSQLPLPSVLCRFLAWYGITGLDHCRED